MAELPSLSTREEIQSYLRGVAEEVGVALELPEAAAELDRRDQLGHFRKKFTVPTIEQLLEKDDIEEGVDVTQECIYLLGNSLGLQPHRAREEVDREMVKWQTKAINGHVEGEVPWYYIADFLSEGSARLVGCQRDEVTVMNTLTVNIHFALASFYRPTKDRYKVVMEDRCFPSDLFAVESQIRWHGYDPTTSIIKIPSREGEQCWRTEDVVKVIEDEADSIALVFMAGVHYQTGYLFDMAAITAAAHNKGILAGFDLAHATGNVELHLHDWDVDFAVWCSYKYLNSGPGGIGGFYVHQRHGNNPDLPRLLGWWSHNASSRLVMSKDLDLVLGASGFHVSNPPVLSSVLLRASLSVFSETSMSQLCAKSRLLTGYLEMLIEQNLVRERRVESESKSEGGGGARYVTIVTPQDPRQRGCQLSLQFSWPVKAAHRFLQRRGVVCDLREPSIMRVAPAPLYNSFTDVQRFYQLLQEAVFSAK